MRTLALSALLACTLLQTFTLNAQTNSKAGRAGFVKRQDYSVGSGPYGIAASDFNGDGSLDLVVSNNSGASITVLNGDGRGNFPRSRSYPAGRYTSGVATADLDGDGHVDIVAANGDPLRGSVSVFRNHGDGTFAPHVNYETNRDTRSVAVADFNSDGVPDLAVAGCSPRDGSCQIGEVAILLGLGDATFGPASHYDVGTLPSFVAAADLNADGIPDLVVVNGGDGIPQTISVLIGLGGGNFAPEVEYSGGPSPVSAVLADFNNDGTLDIAVDNLFQNTLSLLPGVGDGTFGQAQVIPARSEPRWLTVSDFDLDGQPDIATTNRAANSISIFLGQGNGQFLTPFTYAVGKQPFSIVAGDFNSDGKPDVATANFGDSTVTVLLSLRGH